jgi:small GTP-binding protein
VIHIIDNSGHYLTQEKEELAGLKKKLKEGHFYLPVLGQFKRGKSTLLNALLGERILPDSVIPLTAVPTLIEKGEKRFVRVHYRSGDKNNEYSAESSEKARVILNEYVTEKENPKNIKGIDFVTLTHMSEILKGIILIDTPGIGSTNVHNTDQTLSFLPKCDAALFIVSADPPITETELDFLKQVKKKVEKILFVLNKTDYLSGDDIQLSVAFLGDVLAENGFLREEFMIVPISAKKALIAAETCDDEMMAESGVNEIKDWIYNLSVNEKDHLLTRAIMRKFSATLEKILLAIRLERRSLAMPVEDLEEKINIFEETKDEMERRLLYTQDILAGEKKRIIQSLEDECHAIREEAISRLNETADEVLENSEKADITAVKDALSAEIPEFFDDALGRITEKYDTIISSCLLKHHNKAADMINTIRSEASEIFDIPAPLYTYENIYEIKYEPYWAFRNSWGGMPAIVTRSIVGTFLSDSRVKKKLRAEIQKGILSLVTHNVENLRWATLQNINNSYRNFSDRLNEEIESAIRDTKGATGAALKKRQEMTGDISGLIEILVGKERHIETILGVVQQS